MIRFVLGVSLFYLAYCGLLFLLQRQMMFPREFVEVPEENPEIPGLEQIWLDTSFGKVEAWYLPPVENADTASAPVVIFAHGNGEVIDFWPQELRRFNSLGLGLLLVEYPGYGRSEGAPSQDSVAETFTVAHDTLSARKDVDAARIVLFGRSLGGGAVCTLAAQRPSAALILMSTFTSARAFAARYLAPGFLVRDPFNNLETVKTYSKPVLVMHGQFDEVVPYRHGVSLYEAAPNAKLITYDSGHNDCPPNWPIFWKDLESFLREAGVI